MLTDELGAEAAAGSGVIRHSLPGYRFAELSLPITVIFSYALSPFVGMAIKLSMRMSLASV
jgi:hypothetical protein